jgi:hypothetical protein
LQPFIEITYQRSDQGSWRNEIIVESYAMNLSVHFLANLANFLLDVTPVEKTMDGGVVNYGYIGDLTCNRVLAYGTKGNSRGQSYERSSTSVQLRQSEINLVAESAGGRTFCLQSEIQLDHSTEPDGTENCDLIVSRIQVILREEDAPPQVVLHSCDVEYSRRLQSIAEGVKINVSVSPVNMIVTAKVAGVLCALTEDVTSLTQSKEPCISRMPSNFQELENLWTPKKIPVCVPIIEDTGSYRIQLTPETKISENMLFNISRISMLFQVEGMHKTSPLLKVKSSISAEVQDWTSKMQLLAQVQLEASYFNESLRKWEPLIEPTMDDLMMRPWEVSVQLFHAKAFTMSTFTNQAPDSKSNLDRRSQLIEKDESMTLVDKQCSEFNGSSASPRLNRKRHSSSDSDPEKADQYLNKLSELIGHLVCDDNESESDDDNSKDSDDMQLSDHSEQVRKLSRQESRDSIATYILVSAKQRLELSLSCSSMEALNTMISSFMGQTELSSHFSKELEVVNQVGPASKVTLSGRLSYEKNQEAEYVVLATAHFEVCDSERSSPELLGSDLGREAVASAEILTPTYKDDTAACWYNRITSTKVFKNFLISV